MVSGKDTHTIKTTDHDDEYTEAEKSNLGERKGSKIKISKNQIRLSRNSRRDLSGTKHKTQKLPDVKNRTSSKFLNSKRKDSSLTKQTKDSSFVKGKKKLSQLAITDGSKFPSRNKKMLMTKQTSVGNKTSRMFAPKLNKDLPISPRQQRLMNKPYGLKKSTA